MEPPQIRLREISTFEVSYFVGGLPIDIKFLIEEGERVASLASVYIPALDKTLAVCHYFLFKEDKIVELWDVSQETLDAAKNDLGQI